MKSSADRALVALLALIVVLLAPFAYIWAWNTLFGVHIFIETNFWTWLATAVLSGLFTVRRPK